MVQKPCLAVGTKLIPGCFVFMSVSELLFVLITFSALANGYRSENWENEELCGKTTPGQGSPVGSTFHQSTQFRVFPISTTADITIYQ